MTITWKLGGRVLSDNDHYVLKVGGEEVKVPMMFKIGTKNGEDLYGYLDHEKLGGLSHTHIYYVLKKCFYGVGLVGVEEQGVVRTDRGIYKLRLFSLGDSRIASDTTWQDNSGKNKLIIFDKVYNHKEQEALYDNKKGKTPQAIYGKLEDEAKDDGGAKAVPSSISAEGFIRYTQAYDSELLGLVLEDQELYEQMFEQDGPTHLVITSLLKMFLPDGKGGRHIAAIQQEGITEQKWKRFFRIALQKASPGTLESISHGITFELLELIVRGDHRSARLLLNENAEWREGFGLQLVNWHQNPLRLFSSYFEVNEEAKAVDKKEGYNTRQTIDAELFKELVDLNPGWLLETDDAKDNYFKRLAIYLKTHQDPILHSVFTSNLPLLHTKSQIGTHLEDLTQHFLSQEPVDLEYCEYLGLKGEFLILAKPFQMKTNKLIVSRIKAASSLKEKLYLLEFFFPCLGPNGKGAVLQHLIEPSTINTCDQAVVIRLFNEIPSNTFIEMFSQYLNNDGNHWLIYNQFLHNFKGDLSPYGTRLLEKLTTLEGCNINHYNQEAVWGLFNAVQGGVFVENFNRYLNRDGNDWRVYNKFLEEFKGDLSPYAPRLFIRLISLGEEKLLAKFTSTGVDLTQTIEELKSGKLTLPTSETKASSAKLESLSRVVKIRYPLTTAEILSLIHKSDKEIIDFCFTEGNEDLKVAILRVYQDRLPWPTKLMLEHFSKAITINPALTAADIIRLTKATTGREIVEFCLRLDNEALRTDIIKAYLARLTDVLLSAKEVLTFIGNKEAVALFNYHIKAIGLSILFEKVGQLNNPAAIVANLLNQYQDATNEELQVLNQYTWARQLVVEIMEIRKKVHLEQVPRRSYINVIKDHDGKYILSCKASHSNAEQSSQGSSFSNEGRIDNLIEGANKLDLCINSVTRVMKLVKEPNLADGGGLLANAVLLSRRFWVNYPIGRFAGNKGMMLFAAGIRSVADFYNHGLQAAVVGFLSNLGQLLKFRMISGTSKLIMKSVTTIISLVNSVVEFTYTIASYFTTNSNDSGEADLLALARSGNVKAQYDLATMLLQEGKRKEAKKWAEKVANRGLKEGLEIFVSILEEDGKAKDAQRIKQMKDLIHAIQLIEIGGNKTEAKRIAHEASDWQLIPGMSVLKRILEEEGDMDGVKNISYVLRAHASMRTGDVYGAKKAARVAAEAGSMYGQVALGFLLDRNGELKEAAAWSKEAMNQGSSFAKTLLNGITSKMFHRAIKLYYDGNITEAEVLAQEAAKYGSYGKAMLAIINGNNQTLEAIYMDEQDEEIKLSISGAVGKILRWKQSSHDLALGFMRSYSSEKARKDAEKIFRENAKVGFVPSQEELAILLIASNRSVEAKKWAEEAAKKGSVLGKDIVALFKDDDTGKEDLYERAKAQGSEELNNKLKPLYDAAPLLKLSEDIKAEYGSFDDNSLKQWFIEGIEDIKKGAPQETIDQANAALKQHLGADSQGQVDVAGQNAGSEADDEL